MIRVGVIGVGYLGQHHARIFSGLEGVELVGIADIDCKKTEEIAGKYNCGSFSGYADLIEACDALSIVTPTTTHHALAMDCLNAGKDLFIEKPITESLDEARGIVDTAQQKGLVLQIVGGLVPAGDVPAWRRIQAARRAAKHADGIFVNHPA